MPDAMYEWIGSIMRSNKVRKVLAERADLLAARLNAIVAADPKGRGKVTRSGGTRPKGRPYEQVGLAYVKRLTAEQELARANGGPEARTAARAGVVARSPRI